MSKVKRIDLDNTPAKTRTSLYIKAKLLKAVDVYCWNKRLSRSQVIVELLVTKLQMEGYIDVDGNLLKSKLD